MTEVNNKHQIVASCWSSLFIYHLLWRGQCFEHHYVSLTRTAVISFHSINRFILKIQGTAVAQWLWCCATNRKVAGSIPAVVTGFFIDIKLFRSHNAPGVDSASNRNEFQENLLGVKAAGA